MGISIESSQVKHEGITKRGKATSVLRERRKHQEEQPTVRAYQHDAAGVRTGWVHRGRKCVQYKQGQSFSPWWKGNELCLGYPGDKLEWERFERGLAISDVKALSGRTARLALKFQIQLRDSTLPTSSGGEARRVCSSVEYEKETSRFGEGGDFGSLKKSDNRRIYSG